MKKAFKFLFLALVIAALALSFAACKPKPEPPDPEQEFQGVTELAPSQGVFTVSAVSNGKEAVSRWDTKFTDDGIRFTVWVKDSSVVTAADKEKSDGIRVYISEASALTGYVAGKTADIFVFADGTVSARRAVSSTSMTAAEGLCTAESFEWAETGENVIGYKIVLTVPYSTVGAAAASAKGQVAVAAELYNTSAASFDATVRGFSLTDYGVDVLNQNTYIVMTDDNLYALNEEPYPTGTFNFKKNVYDKTQSYWNLEEDYLQSDGGYDDRTVVLEGSQGTGKYNNLYFYKAESTLTYCEAVFEIPENALYFQEKYAKFGYCLINENNSGVFFFIDAAVNSNNVFVGVNAGYCFINGGLFDWDNAPQRNVGWSADAPVKLGLFRDGELMKFLVDGKIIFTLEQSPLSYDEAVMPAVFSFNLGLKLTDYRVTTDENDEAVKALSGRAPAYAGESSAEYQLLNSAALKLDLTEKGKLDWSLFGKNASLAPYEYKANVAESLFGTLAAVNADVAFFGDFLYQTSVLSWSDGAVTPSNSVSGNIPGLTLNGTTAKFTYKLNVTENRAVTYYIWFGGYEAVTDVTLYDSERNVLYSEKTGSVNGRTVGCLTVSVVPDVTTELTVELAVGEDTATYPQVWLLASAAVLTADIPAEEPEPSVDGEVSAKLTGRIRNAENIDLTAVGTKDWIFYGKDDFEDFYSKAGENGYFGSVSYLGELRAMPDYYTGNAVSLTFTDGKAPDQSKTFDGVVPALSIIGTGKVTQKLNVKAGEARYMLWAGAWIGSDVTVKIYDNEETKYTGTISAGKMAMLDITVSSSADAVLNVEFTSTDQIWFLGGAVGEVESKEIVGGVFGGQVKASFLESDRASAETDITAEGTKDWAYFGLYDAVEGYLGKNTELSYIGDLNVNGNIAAYPFGDFYVNNAAFAWSDGTFMPSGNITGDVPAVSLYGNGSSMTLTLTPRGSENFSYYLYIGGHDSTLTVDVTDGSGNSLTDRAITVGNGSGAAVGRLRLDLSGVSEGIINVKMTCAGQQIWLCAVAAGETPLQSDTAFNGSILMSSKVVDRSNATIDMTETGSLDWQVFMTDPTDIARKNTDAPIIGQLICKNGADPAGSLENFFYNNAGTISWRDGDENHASLSQTGNFPGLRVGYGYKFSYAVEEGFKGTVYIWLGTWTTVADVRVTDSENNLLDYMRIGDTEGGKTYCIALSVDSAVKTTLFVDVDTVECGIIRNVWAFGTAVGVYVPPAGSTFKGQVTFAQSSLDRENYTLDLTAEGTLDWTAYNDGSAAQPERKNVAEENRYIGALTLGAYTEYMKEDNFFYNNSGTVSWSDGTATPQFTSSRGQAFPGLLAGLKSARFTLELKAEAGKRIVYTLYFGGWNTGFGARVYDGKGVIKTSRVYGSYQGVDTVRLEIAVSSETDASVWADVYVTSSDANFNVASANLMIMGATARYEETGAAFDGGVSHDITALNRSDATFDVSAAGTSDWRVYNTENRFGYLSKADVSDSYIGSLTFEGRLASHFGDYLYQNNGTVSWTDGTDGEWQSQQGGNVGALTTRDTFVLKLYAKQSADVTYTVWLGGYNNAGSVYVLYSADGSVLAKGVFGADGGYVGCLTFSVTGCAADAELTLKLSTVGQESWLFGAAAKPSANRGI